MDLFDLLIFFLVPAIAAAINSVAGGGTFLTFPIFIMHGLSPLQANVMSTVALWPGTISSAFGYREKLVHNRQQLQRMLVMCSIGGSLGALTLLYTPELMFERMVPWLLLFATLVFTFGQYVIGWLHRHYPHSKHSGGIAIIILQCMIAFYGGYFGAGIGILMLAMMQFMGLSNIHEMNALKVLLAAAINAATVIIFIVAGAVVWKMAGIMVAGGIVGGYVGSRLSLKIPPAYIRLLISIIGFSMTGYFFLR